MASIDRPTLARRALLDALRVANLLDRLGGALARQAGITSAQWLCLGLLVQVGGRGLTPTELCRQLCVSKQNMTGMVVRLQQKGLIERTAEPADRRSFRVRATPLGTRLIQQLEPDGREFFLRHVEPLDDRSLQSLAETLAALLDGLRDKESEAQAG